MPGTGEAGRFVVTKESEIERLTAAYPPLPGLEYRQTNWGEIWQHKLIKKVTDSKTGETKEIWLPITSPFAMPAFLRMIDADEAYGLRVALEDLNGKSRTIDFDRGELSRLTASELKSRLMRAGLRVDNNGETEIIAALKKTKPPDEIVAVSRTGRHVSPDGTVYLVSCGGRIFGDIRPDQTIELLNPIRHAEAGGLADWQAAVRAASAAENCPHWALCTAAGFAGALTDICELESHGMHVSGPSSLGKTTGLRLAVSPWSSPRPGAGLLKSMLSTSNAIEVLAQQSRGTVLALDEAASIDGETFGQIIYMVAGNTGKSRRKGAENVLQETATWSVFGLSSGEQPLAQKLRENGGRLTAGMTVRWISIDVSDVNPKVDEETFARIAAINRHYGHAGPAFLKAIAEHGWHKDPDPLRQRIHKTARNLASTGKVAGTGPLVAADATALRAALAFAIITVAGELAKTLQILPAEINVVGAAEWAWERFIDSHEAETLKPNDKALANIRNWTAELWDVEIKKTDLPYRSMRGALAWYDDDVLYIPTARISEAAGGVLSPTALGRLFARKGLLHSQGTGGRIAIRYVPSVGPVDAYALKRAEFHHV